MKTSIVIPVFNQITYTEGCLKHIESYTDHPYELIIIDNGSTDGTADLLKTLKAKVITNLSNEGVYKAWNQGITSSIDDYIVIMNNDILVTPNWLNNLIDFMDNTGYSIAGPAMREGKLDYDLIGYSQRFIKACYNATRIGELCNFSCVAIKRSVFERIGLFDDRFFVTRGDDDFLLRAKEAGIIPAVTGSSFVHHYSELTQRSLIAESLKDFNKRDDEIFYQKWNNIRRERTWLEKNTQKFRNHYIRWYEILKCGYTLKMPKPRKERLINISK